MEHLTNFIIELNEGSEFFPITEDHEKFKDLDEKAMSIKTQADFMNFVKYVEDLDIVHPEDTNWLLIQAVAKLK